MKHRIFLALLNLLPLVTYAYDSKIGDFYYNFNESAKTAEITYIAKGSSKNSTAYSGVVIIPSEVNYKGDEYKVTSIGEYAFCYCNITSVTISESIDYIGECAFAACRKIESIIIPNNVTNIGGGFVKDCNNLISITIPNTVKTIGRSAFWGCTKLKSVNIPDNIISIGNSFFRDCTSLTYIKLPDMLSSIGDNVFSGCSSLSSINLPNGISSIGSSAFANCISLTSITIPNTVTSIGNNAFEGCNSLTSITIPNSVTFVGCNAFSGTAWYNSQTDGLIYVGKVAYRYKGEMPVNTNISITDGTTQIADYAFEDCSGLASITIPNSVTSIGSYAFKYCNSLASITIPSSVTSIGDAFSGCSGLTTIILEIKTPFTIGNIGNSLVTLVVPIGAKAAYQSTVGWSSFTKIVEVGEGGVIGSKFEIDGIYYTIDENNKVSLSNTKTAISGSIVIPSQVGFNGKNYEVISIRSEAFEYRKALSSITIPNSVTSIGNKTFFDCSGLTSAIIGSGVMSIGSEAFSGTNLKKTIWLTNTPPSGYKDVRRIGAVNYVSNEQFDIDNKVVYKFLSSHFVVDGIRYVPVSPSDRTCDAIDCIYDPSIESINIDETVTNKGITLTVLKINPYTCYHNKHLRNVKLSLSGSIGDYAFCGCSSLKTATLGQNVTSIGGSAFHSCSKLESIVIPDAVTTLGSYAFQNCTAMTSVKTGGGIETINEKSFFGCSSLKEINIGSKVKNINNEAFSDCSSLPAITIPQAVTSIGYYVFSGCTSLAKVTIADSENTLTLGSNGSNPIFSSCPLDYVYIGRDISYQAGSDYGYSPFYRNTSLRAVKIADKETWISDNEFYGCANLQRVIIGDGVTNIGNWAFSGCSSLEYFAFGSQMANIGQDAFSDCTALVEITSKAKVPPVCRSQALDDINKWECKLYVPKDCLPAYEAADQWKDFFFKEEGTGTLLQPVMGDANDDGKINIADIVEMVNTKNNKASAYFNYQNADMDGNSVINQADIDAVVNIIMNQE